MSRTSVPTVRVSAPGKTILMGEHAAVYGRPALVAAVDRRLEVELSPAQRPGVALDLPAVGVREQVSWAALRRYADTTRSRWQDYRARPEPHLFRRLRGEDPAHLVKVALGEASAHLGTVAGEEGAPTILASALRLHLDSAIPIGAGFGSSAATAVAVLAACCAAHGHELDGPTLHHLALEVERRQHGQPSGVDQGTVIHGGLVWARRAADGEGVSLQPVRARSPLLGALRIYHSGAPEQSTGEVVAAVGARRQAVPGEVEGQLERMETATAALRVLLEAPAATSAELMALIGGFEACLEALGVVPPAVRAVIRRIEAAGGAAKISGAGALSGEGAGSVLVYHPDDTALGGLLPAHWQRLDLRLGAPGVRRESNAPSS